MVASTDILPLIRRLEVRQLFGAFDYTIDFSDSLVPADRNLLLLYGPNGSGKTTLLRLIYAALCPNTNEGLRGYILSIPFTFLSLELSSGVTIKLMRPEATTGEYRLFYASDRIEIDLPVVPNTDGRVNSSSSPKIDLYNAALRSHGVHFIFVSHNRHIRTTYDFARYAEPRPQRSRAEIEEHRALSLNREAQGQGDRSTLDIDLVAKAVLETYRRRLLEQGRFEQHNTNDIYLDIATRLASPYSEDLSKFTIEYETLLTDIDELSKRITPMLDIGIMAAVPFQQFGQILESAPVDRRPDLVRILRPFLDSLRSRTEALRPLSLVITGLVETLSRFYSRKEVKFSIIEGFEIYMASGTTLPLHALSSGEKQLFFLLSSAVLCRSDQCIFLIDEPELSLNVAWQRLLVKSLLGLVAPSNVQFILATHSLEILTEYKHRIKSLDT